MDERFVENELIRQIKDQMAYDDPIEVRLTYERMKRDRFREEDIYLYLARALSAELLLMNSEQRDFDMGNYIKLLKSLPF